MSSTDQAGSPSPTQQRVTRSPDWRLIYTNGIGLGFGDNEVRLNLGFDQDLAKPGMDVIEQATIVMTHRAAKMLVYTLGAVIANFEAVNGLIPLDPIKIQEIDRSIKAQAVGGPGAKSAKT